MCTNIENCADIRCTTDSDQYCFECESNYGAALGESAYRNLNTSCEGKLILIIIIIIIYSLFFHFFNTQHTAPGWEGSVIQVNVQLAFPLVTVPLVSRALTV